MIPQVAMALFTGLLVATENPPNVPEKVQSFMGQWVVVSVEAPNTATKTAQQFDGAELTFAFDPRVRETMLTITKNKGEKTERVDVWRIEAHQTDKGPHTLSLIGDQVGEGGLRRQKIYEWLGIYEMSGNDLKICLAMECVFYDVNGPVATGTNRHLVRTFDPKLGILLTLKRAPKVTTGPAPPAASAPDAKGTRDLHFQRGVPASDLKIELTPAAKATRRPKAIFLPVKLTNSSSDEISTTLAHEWHGGLWPPTGLYASVTPAEQTKAAAFEPVYLAGENPEITEATILAAGKSKELTLRMDWRGTGSVPARRLMESSGTYNVQLLLVCEVSGKQLYVISPTATVELPDVKPMGARREPWAGEPVIPMTWVRGGKLSTIKRLPKANEVTAVRISGELNQTNRPLTAANFAAVLDSMRPVQADDPKYKDLSYAPWCSAEFETPEGPFRLTLYIGGLALVEAPDGSVGLVNFEGPVVPPAAPVMADDKIKIEDGFGFYALRSGESFQAFWESLKDERKMKGRVSDHLAKEQIASINMLEVNMHIRHLETELLAFMSEGNRFGTGPLPKGFDKDRYLVALFRTKKGDYGLITRYAEFAVIELNGVVGVAPVVAGGKSNIEDRIEDRRGFYTMRSGESFQRFWEALTDEHKLKGRVSDHLAKEQIAAIILLEVNIAIPEGDYLHNELLGFISEGNRFETGRLPAGFEKDRPSKYVVALFRTKQGAYGLITRYPQFAVIEFNGCVGVAPVVAAIPGPGRFRFDKANVIPKDDPIYPVLAQYQAAMRKREEEGKQIRSTFYDWIRVDSPAAAQLFPKVRFASLRWNMHRHPEHKGSLSLAQGLEVVVAIDTTTNRLSRELGVHGNHEEFGKLLTDYQVTLRDAKEAQLVWDASCEVYGQGSKTEPMKQTSDSQWHLGISSYDQTTSEVDGVKTVVTKTHYTRVLVDPKTHQVTSWKMEVESSNQRKVPTKRSSPQAK